MYALAEAAVLPYARRRMADQQIITLPQAPAVSRSGFAAGFMAYLVWGFVAIYFAMLSKRGLDSLHIVAYRVAWCAVFIAILLTLLRQWHEVIACLRSRASVLALCGSTVMIAFNWWIYVYAVETRQVSYASLGYYINPLVTVLIGVLVLHERLRPWQIAAAVVAAIGVTHQTIAIGSLPWISLGLAISFGFYGLLRKTMRAGSLVGLMIETALITPIGLAFIGYHASAGTAPAITLSTHGLLALSGIVTATPLLLFAFAARRLKLTTMGFLQYFSPTIQLILAVTYFGEPFDRSRLVTFVFIWAAVAIFLIDQFRAARRSQPVAEPADMET